MSNPVHTTNAGIDIKILEGRIKFGEVEVKSVEILEEQVSFDEYKNIEEVENVANEMGVKHYKDLSDNELLNTDLRDADWKHITPGTRKAEILRILARLRVGTSKGINKRMNKESIEVSGYLTEMRRDGFIAIVDTDGNGSYRYCLTHKGVKERIEQCKET